MAASRVSSRLSSVTCLLLALALTPPAGPVIISSRDRAGAAQALTCSVCNSVFDEDCITSPQNYVKQCVPPPQYNNSDHPPLCRKTKLLVYKPEMPLRVSRSCGYLKDLHHKNCRDIYPPGMFLEVCQCFTDACNAAPSSLPFGAGAIWRTWWWPAVTVILALFR